jgi:hypothetical protein
VLTGIVEVVLQAHMRAYLQELLDLIVDFWDTEKPVLLKLMLNLLARLAVILQEDMRHHASRLVPRFVQLFQEAGRSGDYHAIEPALQALLPSPMLCCFLPTLHGVLRWGGFDLRIVFGAWCDC